MLHYDKSNYQKLTLMGEEQNKTATSSEPSVSSKFPTMVQKAQVNPYSGTGCSKKWQLFDQQTSICRY